MPRPPDFAARHARHAGRGLLADRAPPARAGRRVPAARRRHLARALPRRAHGGPARGGAPGPAPLLRDARAAGADRRDRREGARAQPHRLRARVGGGHRRRHRRARRRARRDRQPRRRGADPGALLAADPRHRRRLPRDAGRGAVLRPRRSADDAVAAVAERAGPRTVALYLSTPSNPTGCVLPRAWLEALAEWARREGVWLLSDEVYEDYVYRGEHVSIAAFAPERTLSVYSFSKAYGMAGNRTGYVVAPPEAALEALKISTHTSYHAPTSGQVAGLRALQSGAGWIERARSVSARSATRRPSCSDFPRPAARPSTSSRWAVASTSAASGASWRTASTTASRWRPGPRAAATTAAGCGSATPRRRRSR